MGLAYIPGQGEFCMSLQQEWSQGAPLPVPETLLLHLKRTKGLAVTSHELGIRADLSEQGQIVYYTPVC